MVLGESEPLNVVGHHVDPKRHILARLRVFWAIERQNLPMGQFSRRVQEKN